jgi:phage terminase large subunit-like protein
MARRIKQDNFKIEDFARTLHERTKQQAERPNIHGYKPHDKQIIFHSAERRHRLYIGGNRSGKTTGGIAEDIWWLTGKHPYRRVPQGGVRGRIIGVDFLDGIEKILKPEMMRWCPVSELRGNSWSDAYDVQERTLHFENGSFVEFMSYEQDVAKFAGTSRHFVHFDEEPPQDIYIENVLRLLDTGGSWWMTLTPVMGMEWMYDEVFLPGKQDPDSSIEVIEVDMTENPYLSAIEIVDTLKLIPEEDHDARKSGKFVRRGGIIYKAFDRKVHVIPALENIPKSWELYASMDHGFNNPTAWLWHGVDGDGRVITFAEHYESEMIVEEHAAQVKLINAVYGRDPGMYIGDPAIAQHNGISGSTVQQEYGLHGIHISLGNNEVLNGINKVNTYLKYGPGRDPRWYITDNCPNLIREIQKYRWKTWSSKKSERANNKYDVPHKKDDHACDSARYFFTIMPDLTPVVQAESKQIEIPATTIDPYKPRFDKNIRKQKVEGDWFIQSIDEQMGGEW